MSHGGSWLWVALLLLLRYPLARGPTSVTEFLPEIDAHFTLNSNVRFVFQAKEREKAVILLKQK